MSKDDFASLMQASVSSGQSRDRRRFSPGEAVEGTVIQIAQDSVFLDVGSTGDARLDIGEVMDQKGNLKVQVGDRLRATVKSLRDGRLELAIALGRGGSSLDVRELESAQEAGTPVEGRVVKAVKSGLEIEVGGVRAFCPASQIDLGFQADLAPYEGRTLEFRVMEIKEGGRSVIVSRRALLELARKEQERALREKLAVGAEMEGNVSSVQKHGAIVDLGGLDGYVHISELAHGRVDRVEDVIKAGDVVKVRVLAIEESTKGTRIRLSVKALKQPEQGPDIEKDEVLAGTVSRASSFGVFVLTAKGEGLVPIKELGLPPGSDHRRVYPPGTAVSVVLVSRDAKSGKLRFSVTGVAGVEERRNYRDFSKAAAGPAGSLGSLGDVLRQKLGLPPPAPAIAHTPPAVQADGAAKTPGIARAEPQPDSVPVRVEAPREPRRDVIRRR